MIIYDYIWLNMIIYDDIWSYMIIYDYIWLYMIIYDYIWLYMIICLLVESFNDQNILIDHSSIQPKPMFLFPLDFYIYP